MVEIGQRITFYYNILLVAIDSLLFFCEDTRYRTVLSSSFALSTHGKENGNIQADFRETAGFKNLTIDCILFSSYYI